RAVATPARSSRFWRARTAAVADSEVWATAERSETSRSARLPRYGSTQTKCSAASAATTAMARTLSRSIVLIPGDAERAEGDERQARRGQLQRELRQAEHEDERGQRPAHRAREGCFQPPRNTATAPPRAEADGGQEEQISRKPGFGGDLQMIVVRGAPVS